MTVSPNMFATIADLGELEDLFECMVSPENLYQDGERSRAQANAALKRIRHDYDHRKAQLRLDEINYMIKVRQR